MRRVAAARALICRSSFSGCILHFAFLMHTVRAVNVPLEGMMNATQLRANLFVVLRRVLSTGQPEELVSPMALLEVQ